MSDRKPILILLGFVAGVSISSQLLGGELTPLPPRSPTSVPSEAPAYKGGPMPQENYYTEFERKARGLSPGQRKELITEYAEKEKEAAARRSYDEAQHYGELQKILKRLNNGVAE